MIKKDLPESHYLRVNTAAILKWALEILATQTLYQAQDWHGGNRELRLYLSQIKGMKDSIIQQHFLDLRSRDSSIPWELLNKRIHILNNSELDGLQLADQICGAFKAAILPGEFSKNHKYHHFADLLNLIVRNSESGILGTGVIETSPYMKRFYWWSEIERTLRKIQDTID